jgi:hypothetical protein
MAPAGNRKGKQVMNGLDSAISDYERRRQAQARSNEANKRTLFDALTAANITEVHVDFDGEGDSGQIESVNGFRGEERAELPATMVRVQNVA